MQGLGGLRGILSTLLWLGMFCGFGPLTGQTVSETEAPVTRIGLAAGGDHFSFLDRGVSGVTYTGWDFRGSLIWQREKPRSEWDVLLGSGAGTYQASEGLPYAGARTFFLHQAGWKTRLAYGRLQTWQKALGLRYDGFTNLRSASVFQNNSGVYESFHSLLLTGSLTRAFTGWKEEGRRLFFRRKAGMTTTRLTFQAGGALLHGGWRPGFSYLTDFTDGDIVEVEENRFALGGWRVQCRVGITRRGAEGDGLSLFYDWDASQTNGNDNPIRWAAHTLQLIYWFNVKPRN